GWGDTTTTPPLSMDTCKEGLSRSREEDFLEEEEEEQEDSAQAASSESVLPGSHELFVTLEPIPSTPSQGGLQEYDAGEGTSGANVSTCPLSTQSQRLAQFRRRKIALGTTCLQSLCSPPALIGPS
ncbi:hypothetical protein G0U57_012218, partial [Chelydra serpentina]